MNTLSNQIYQLMVLQASPQTFVHLKGTHWDISRVLYDFFSSLGKSHYEIIVLYAQCERLAVMDKVMSELQNKRDPSPKENWDFSIFGCFK